VGGGADAAYPLHKEKDLVEGFLLTQLFYAPVVIPGFPFDIPYYLTFAVKLEKLGFLLKGVVGSDRYDLPVYSFLICF
jgi:hypothetical protein